MARVLLNTLVPMPYRKSILNVVRRTLRQQSCRQGIVSVTFVDDRVIRRLNKQYRFKEKPTDVLSFSLGDDTMLGDVVISVPTARRNAGRFERTLESELKRLAVHGTLHLLGYRHKTKTERTRMEKQEQCALGEEF